MNIPHLDWETFSLQIDLLGYRVASARQAQVGDDTLWLAASSEPWTRPPGVRFEDHDSVAELRFPVRHATFDEDMRVVFNKLDEVNQRGVSRLSLPEGLYRTKPEGTQVGSYKKNDPMAYWQHVLWFDVDCNAAHEQPKGARYPLPSPEQGLALLESAFRDGDTWRDSDPAVIVSTGKGSWQGFITVYQEVTVDDFKRVAARLEEMHQVHLDKSVIGRRGPIRVWGHTRVENGKVVGRVTLEKVYAKRYFYDEVFYDFIPAQRGWLERTPAGWDENTAAQQRYAARIAAELEAARQAEEAMRQRIERNRAAKANGKATGQNKRPGDRFNEKVGSTVALLNDIGYTVDQQGDAVYVHRGYVPAGSDGSALTIDTPPENYADDDEYEPYEALYLFSTNAAAELGLDTERAYAPFDILVARCEGDYTFAARLLNAVKDDHEQVISLMQDCTTKAEWEQAIPALTKPKRRENPTLALIKRFNSLVTVEDLGADPVKYDTAAEVILAMHNGDIRSAAQDMRELITTPSDNGPREENHS